MQRSHPLQDHPEFSIRQHSGCIEYRVENWRISRDGSRRVLRGYGWSWLDALVPVLTALLWEKVRPHSLLSSGQSLLQSFRSSPVAIMR